jgi:5-dehydro-4-deoxyglucarate dehydratase
VFFRPYVELRRRHLGYAVSLVKALTVVSGHQVGGVRPPLTEPQPAHVEEAWALVEQAREALA